MRKWVIILAFLVLHPINAQTLKIIYGNRLYYQNGDRFIKIKELNDGSSYQGYDVVDSSHIFIAYNPEISAEASVYIAIFNTNTGDERIIGELGGTGESFFQYNKENDFVVFNWNNGINVFKLHKSPTEFVEKITPTLLIEGDCYLPYWIDNETIGYHVWENEQWVVKTCKVNK